MNVDAEPHSLHRSRSFRRNIRSTSRRGRPSAREPRYATLSDYEARIPMRDGIRLAADVIRPHAGGMKFPALVTTSVYTRQLQRSVIALGQNEAGVSEFWVPRGYAHVIVDVRGSQRFRRRLRPLRRAGAAGPLRHHRMGGRAAVVQRQRRHERHLLHGPHAAFRGRAAAAAPEGDLSVRRVVRLLPRRVLPRRHRHQLHDALDLVRHESQHDLGAQSERRPAEGKARDHVQPQVPVRRRRSTRSARRGRGSTRSRSRPTSAAAGT